jgi:hypothetical protein
LPAFLDAVRRSGYAGRMSVEAKLIDAATDLPAALALLKSGG